MIVQIRVEVLPVELIDSLGMGNRNVAVADMLANHGAVLALDQQLVEQPGHGVEVMEPFGPVPVPLMDGIHPF